MASCTVVGSSIAFGAHNQAVVNQTGSITVQCTNGIGYNVGLDAGVGTGTTVSDRKMRAADGATLNYA
ncbi:spore coat protein U-like protein [Herbaspirillum rubrisubalbicans]|uniref:spore coat protein U domain-containing protein n=1 Tax=Herbaspirillum rubrisubalbicans TaxID=80842 RepID=UPI0020A02ED7|nr:spore coat protein U-like protein [Herbaspirillum rubrisubalbicans]